MLDVGACGPPRAGVEKNTVNQLHSAKWSALRSHPRVTFDRLGRLCSWKGHGSEGWND